MSERSKSLTWFVLADKDGRQNWKTHAAHKGDVWINAYIETGKSCAELMRLGHTVVKTEIVKETFVNF